MSSADSPGHSTSKAEAVFIFDLDRTILSVNSFPYWVLYMLTGHFDGLNPVERLALSIHTGQILLKRKVLGQSHYRTKQQLQRLWVRAVGKDVTHAATHRLNIILQGYIRPNIRSVLVAVAQQRIDAFLATSAAGEYAQELAKAMGFIHVLTTPLCGEPDRLENCGKRKCDRVLAMLAMQGWDQRMRILFTDHEDDLSLIRECQRTFWFGSNEDMEDIQAKVPQAKIIACRNLSDAEILRLCNI